MARTTAGKPRINTTSKKKNPAGINAAMPSADGGFSRKSASRQTGRIREDRGRGGGPTHRVKSGIGGPNRPGKIGRGTKKNSLQGSDSTTAGARRGMRGDSKEVWNDQYGYGYRGGGSVHNVGIDKGRDSSGGHTTFRKSAKRQTGRIDSRGKNGRRSG